MLRRVRLPNPRAAWEEQAATQIISNNLRILTSERMTLKDTISKRQPTCVSRNIEARSFNHCCSGKAISITYFVRGYVAFDIQHAMAMRHTVVCSLPGCTVFFHTIS